MSDPQHKTHRINAEITHQEAAALCDLAYYATMSDNFSALETETLAKFASALDPPYYAPKKGEEKPCQPIS